MNLVARIKIGFKKMISFLGRFDLFLKEHWLSQQRDKNTMFRAIEINTINQQILLQLKGKNITFHKKIDAVMGDLSILKGLSSYDACFIGLYYGRASQKISKASSLPTNFPFILEDKTGQYRIISENREGEITYLDKIYRKNFVELPTAIIQSRYIIEKFDPTQACYIGMRAGMMLEKILEKDKKNTDEKIKEILSTKPILRVVK